MAPPPARCGTPSGYLRHKRLKEEVCAECVEARRRYNREYGRRRKQLPRDRSLRTRDTGWLESHPAKAVKPPIRSDDYGADPLDLIRPAVVPEADRRAARVMLRAAARALRIDLADETQAADAVPRLAQYAREVFGALGFLGEMDRRASPGERKQLGSRFVHGTRSAVERHEAAGTPLCGPCQRWADVQSRKNAQASGERPGEAEQPRKRTG